AGRIRREGMTEWDPGHAGDGREQLRLADIGDVVDVVSARASAVELVLLRRWVVTDVEVVIARQRSGQPAGHSGTRVFRNRHLAHHALIGIATHDQRDVIDPGERGYARGDKERAPV